MHQCNPVLRSDGYVIACIDPSPDNHENQWYGKGAGWHYGAPE